MRTLTIQAIVLITCIVLMAPTGAEGATVQFTINLDGAQANAGAGSGSAATGSGTATLDTTTNDLTWTINFTEALLDDGIGSVTLAHFHRAPININGGVIDPPGNIAVLGQSSPIIGASFIPAVEAANFLNEGVYLNIHTTAHAGGEIRGQLIPSQVTIESARDNTLYEPNIAPLSNGAGSYMFAGRSGDGLRKRGLIMFDIAGSGIPAGSVITSTILELSMSRTIAGPEQVGLHRVRSDWGEGTSDAAGGEGGGAAATPGDATWLYTFFNTDFWINPGGDFLAVASDTQVIADIGQYTWGSTAGMVADVQNWLDSPAENFGWLLLGNESSPTTAKRFNTREFPRADDRPKLIVQYRRPCLFDIPGDLDRNCIVNFLDVAIAGNLWLEDCRGFTLLPTCSTGIDAFEIGPDEGVDFQQVDFSFGPTPVVDSDWGAVVVDPVEIARNTGLSKGYLNVVTEVGWVVTNLYVQSSPIDDYPEQLLRAGVPGPNTIPPLTVYFDLGAASFGQAQSAVNAKVLFTSEPLANTWELQTMVGSAPDSRFAVSSVMVNAQGDLGNDVPNKIVSDISPPPPGGYPPFDPGSQIQQPDVWKTLPLAANVEAANNQCVPMGSANALQYLENAMLFNIPHPHVPGLRGDGTLVGQLDLLMDRIVVSRCEGDGESRCGLIRGLLEYLCLNTNYQVLSIRYQGEDPVYPNPDCMFDSVPCADGAGMNLIREGNKVTWSWIHDRISDGAGVVLHYGKYNDPNDPTIRTGGHNIRVFASGRIKGVNKIHTLDDGYQTSKKKDGTCQENGGLRWSVEWWLKDTDNDGQLNLSGTNNEVEFALAIKAPLMF
jgi:hypothetical protein